VVELGYVGNDIAFLRNLQDSGYKFRFLFTLYSGIEMAEVLKNVGVPAMTDVFSYVTAAQYEYQPNFGPALPEFHEAWEKAYPSGSGVEWGSNAVQGYMTGLVIERTLATTESLDQMAIHNAVFDLSDKLKTLVGTFKLDATGAQIGEITPLGQLQPDGKGGLTLVAIYPPEFAKGQAVLGK